MNLSFEQGIVIAEVVLKYLMAIAGIIIGSMLYKLAEERVLVAKERVEQAKELAEMYKAQKEIAEGRAIQVEAIIEDPVKFAQFRAKKAFVINELNNIEQAGVGKPVIMSGSTYAATGVSGCLPEQPQNESPSDLFKIINIHHSINIPDDGFSRDYNNCPPPHLAEEGRGTIGNFPRL